MTRMFKIGEISRLYHIGVDSLRYYEEIGLICPRRSEAGYRLYSDREIWQLNVIRDLRELGFPMESIKHYMDFQNVDSAITLLREEQNAIREKMKALKKLQKNVEKRIDNILVARDLPIEQIFQQTLPERRCYRMQKGYSEEHEMDILIKELVNRSGEHLSIIGNNQFGSVISLAGAQEGPEYRSVFVVDDLGDSRIPGGEYLRVCYRGDYSQTELWIRRLMQYAEENGLEITGDILEVLWIDIHTTRNSGEYITELQAPVKKSTGCTKCGKQVR